MCVYKYMHTYMSEGMYTLLHLFMGIIYLHPFVSVSLQNPN